MNKQKLLTTTLILSVILSMTGLSFKVSASSLAATSPDLGAAASFSVLGKAGVTNVGNSVLSGNVGADSSITGFPPGTALAQVLAPEVNGAEADASTAFDNLAGQGPGTTLGSDLTGANLVPGVYTVPGVSLLPGTLTLDGPGVYIFLTDGLTASGSVNLINGARACDVFWHDASSASIVGGSFVGTIIASTSITFGDAASLDGRALALTGNVTLINNNISGPSCAGVIPTDVPTDVPTGVPTDTATDTAAAATATLLPGISNLPSTGGGPIQNQAFPWSLVVVGGFSAMFLALGVREYRRTHLLK
ncbi:MAG: hypothetical protein A2X25_15395 [Chloroflexi bacterium GWB2_49_20]|nr:MAG: hypothetical protein A2X25_15395 [Chloroflexi bacterium GWB2_49_20]OGN77452.1 MAG: hypothetical protein A2X26_13625 [Chloroflexi bacterium GWC2_49_37]OGN84844.1 MAG: hypothetical protein A2X27_14825 [Chloroflexi bacterium GWD2_49_16]